MPCDGGPSHDQIENQRAYGVSYTDRDLLTRVACDLAHLLEDPDHEISELTRRWIVVHKRADAERRAEEERVGLQRATRARALRKLSPDERSALGLPRGEG
jgi:hypothetical protein